jgi:hypothetical protein
MTAQVQDLLYFKNEAYFLNGQLSALGGIPEANRPKLKSYSSACWRGYIAKWLIDENNWLKIVEINVGKLCYEEHETSLNLLYSLYPGHDYPVTATWVNGEIEAAFGKVVGRCGQYC